MSASHRKINRTLLWSAVAAVAPTILCASRAAAQTQTLVYSAYDTYEVGSNSWNGDGQYSYNYFYGSNTGSDVNYLGNPYSDPSAGGNQYQYPIIDFQLPTLPADQQVISAEVTLRIANNGTNVAQNFSADLNALDVGPYAPNNAQFQQSGTLIAPAIINPSSPTYTDLDTNTSQSTALANFINSQGYVPFNMLTMRVTPETDPTGSFYDLGSADWPGMNPVLTLTTAAVLSWNNATATSPADGVTWDTSNNNWNNGTSATTYSDPDLVIFNDTNNGNYSVSLNTTVSPTSVTVNNSAGNYTIGGTGEISTATLAKSGSDTLNLGTALNAGSLSISAGTLKLASGVSAGAGPAPASSINIASLSITGSGQLDINNNHVIISYGSSDPIATVAAYIKSGYNQGHWDGPGIISSAAATLNNGHAYGVGWADGANKIVSGLSSGQIELKYTLIGDANLDGTVNGSDFSILAANFGQGYTNWDQGNFEFTPAVNGTDFSALAANFGQGDSGADAAVSQADIAALDSFALANNLPLPAIAAVPEPACMGLIATAGFAALARRKRR